MTEEIVPQESKVYIEGSRAKYLKEWRDKKKLEIQEKRATGDGDWNEFQEHVRVEALRSDAPAAVMGIYKEMLKLARDMKKDRGIGADELARRNIEAERQLREGGYISE